MIYESEVETFAKLAITAASITCRLRNTLHSYGLDVIIEGTVIVIRLIIRGIRVFFD